MADQIVVLNNGRIEQVGSPLELYDRPANLFVAGFIGSPKMNLVGGKVATEFGAETIGVRPEHIVVTSDGSGWKGVVSVAEHVGSDTFLYVTVEGAGDVTVRAIGEIGLEAGAPVRLAPDRARLHRFDKNGKALPQ